MILDSNDDDSDSKQSDTYSVAGEDIDVYLNHYRIPLVQNGSINQPKGRRNREQVKYTNEGKMMSLFELAAQKVACHNSFGQVEHFIPTVPEPMQCRIAFWSFPQDEEDIRLYTCLANGNADVFIRAEDLISLNCVCDMLQVGFHLSANVKYVQDSTDDLDCHRVAVTFDRRRITSCSCSCSGPTFWCQHAVAVCLQRIRKPHELTLRAPVSESLQRLEKNQLQKFAQYLINELPQQILPAAQKLLDELLSGEVAVINQNPAAPDPTAGATINEQTSWCLDDTHLSSDIQKILLKQCTAQPTVCSDIQALHTSAPPAAAEYSQLLRPVRGREPEGLWNLISIVGEMMKRHDSNFFLLLEIMTQEILAVDKVVTWWFEAKVSLHSGSTIHCSNNKTNSQSTSQYSSSNFCDEIVHLWRLAAMNPSISSSDRNKLYGKFFQWHLEILKKHNGMQDSGLTNSKPGKRNMLELFPGFKPAMEGCLIEWMDWDDKRCKIIAPKETEEEKTKSSKSSKRKKKKSKTSKQCMIEQKQSTSSEAQIQDESKELVSTHPEADVTNGKSEIQGDSKKEDQMIEHPINLDEIGDHSSQEISRMVNAKPYEPTTNFNNADDFDQSEPSRLDRKGSDTEELQEIEHDKPQEPGQNEPQELEQDEHQEHVQDEHQEQVQDEPQPLEPDLLVYFMERPPESPPIVDKPESVEDLIKVNLKKLNDPLEILYSKAEGLYAHGHHEEARQLAHRVALEIMNLPSYPSFKQLYTPPKRRKKKGSLDNQMSIVTSEALSRIAFLCNVLSDNQENHNLVFRLALFGVEMKLAPAATKPLEVKLVNQKHDLIMLLRSIPLHESELVTLREKAQVLRDGTSGTNLDALTTLILGNLIFEAFVLSKLPICSSNNARSQVESSRASASGSISQSNQYQLEEHYIAPSELTQQPNSHNSEQMRQLIVYGKIPQDTSLGFHAALNALSVKVNVSEADHPLLCEGIRRQRGELALSLLIHYKDDQDKLDLILKHLLTTEATLSQCNQDATEKLVKKTNISQDSNSPTEASAYFMFELAKTVFDKAGGNSLQTHLFRPQLMSQNGGRGIHRKLHMCMIRIALYALGLQNRTSSNWMQRTYNGRASFIHEQALDLGLPAIKYLSENWEGYLTPVEVASIADKAGTNGDDETKRVAAEMAKSCLKYANYLDLNAVRRILAQCKEQSVEMLEEACSEIEFVAESDSVCADVLFATARAWYSLYEKLINDENHAEIDRCQLRQESYLQEPDVDTSNWGAACNLPINETMAPLNWDMCVRFDFIPTMYTPTYKSTEYVKSAYRVGIKALDALKPSLNMGSKHNPKKEDEVVWLLELSKSLGRDSLHNFSRSATKNITNPLVLQSISFNLIKFFETLPTDHVDRINILLPLIDKCLDRFVRQVRDLMKHISHEQTNYLDSIIDAAQNLTGAANTLAAAGYFNELLRIVDTRRNSKKFRGYIDTRHRHLWLNQLLSVINHCICIKCRTGREMSSKFLTCSQRI